MLPADYSDVFCIHSTDGSGNGSSFNPTPRDSTINFATIGEAVESSWPKDLCIPTEDPSVRTFTKIKFGTSFATPIAVGIAALVLRYTSFYIDTDLADELKKFASMQSVLKRLSNHRNGFHYLTLRSNPGAMFAVGRDPAELQSEIKDVIMRRR